MYDLCTWKYNLPITHLQKQSGDNPASAHTKHRPEETNLSAVNTSEKEETMDWVVKASTTET